MKKVLHKKTLIKCLIWTNDKSLADILAASVRALGRKCVVKYDPTIGSRRYKVYQTNQLQRYAHLALDEFEARYNTHKSS